MATSKTAADPKVVTIYGRLSFPQFTAQEAYDKSQGSNFPAKSVSEAKPNFTLLLEPAQLAKLKSHIEDNFLPYCIEQSSKGEKRDVLSDKEVKALTDQLNEDDYDGAFNIPLKALSEKSQDLAPECVASVKVIGNAGVDLDLKAIVRDESELLVADADIISYPTIKPLGMTQHSMYPGCYVGVTLNLYAYHNGKNPGFSAGGSVAVFRADADRFGGGVGVDENEMFLDD